MDIIYSVAALTFLSAIAKAIQDILAFKWDGSIFEKHWKWFDHRWWNPEVSWRNKYRFGKPDCGEAFWGSSTIFVFLTDAWHFFQFIRINSLILAIALLTEDSLKWFFVLRFVYGAAFVVFYEIILRKKP